MTFNAEECERLARELAEDDEATTTDDASRRYSAVLRIANNALAASEQLLAAVAEVERLREKVSDMRSEAVRAAQNHVDSQTAGAQERIARKAAEADRDTLAAELTGELRAVKDERDGLHRTLKAVVDFAIDECGMPTRDMLGSEAPLRVMRKLKSQLDSAIVERDEARRECERLQALTLNPGATLHGSTITEIAADRSLLAENLAVLTEDVAKYRALVEQMRPVYEAAELDREELVSLKHFYGNYPHGDRRFCVFCVKAKAVLERICDANDRSALSTPTDAKEDGNGE